MTVSPTLFRSRIGMNESVHSKRPNLAFEVFFIGLKLNFWVLVPLINLSDLLCQ